MADPPDHPATPEQAPPPTGDDPPPGDGASRGESLPRWTANVQRYLQGLLTLAGVIGLVYQHFKETPVVLAVAAVVTLAGPLWFAVSWRRRRPGARAAGSTAARPATAQIRGLLPFESGDTLLGRETEALRVRTTLRSEEFRFGYLTGDPGTGKTSLLRAAVIPALLSESQAVVYVARSGQDPGQTLLQMLRESESLSTKAAHKSLPAQIRAIMEERKPRRLVIVLDQFEEFFVSNRGHADRRRLLQALRQSIEAHRPHVRCLVSLRRDFVDDLLDLVDVIPEVALPASRLSLKNIGSEDARAVLTKSAEEDGVPFARDLIDSIVRDISLDDQVRPIELQLVATRLLDERIFDVKGYKDVGGARGIVARFVEATVLPVSDITDADRELGSLMLRAICPETGSTRRPVGLTLDEIAAYVASESSAALQGSRDDFRHRLATMVTRCKQATLLVEEDGRINLAHDYIVRAAQHIATSIRTRRDEANRLLAAYLEQYRADPRTSIPARHLRAIVKAKVAADFPGARDLLRRSRTRLRMTRLAVVVAAVALACAVAPPRVTYSIPRRILSLPSRWTEAKASLVAAGVSEAQRGSVFDLTVLPPRSVELGDDVVDVVLSATGNRVLTVRKSGLYLATLRTLATPMRLLECHTCEFVGFTEDEDVAFAVDDDHRFHEWHITQGTEATYDPPATITAVLASPRSEAIVASSSAHVALLPVGPDRAPVLEPMRTLDTRGPIRQVELSPDGRWLIVQSDGDGTYLWEMGRESPSKPLIAAPPSVSHVPVRPWPSLDTFDPGLFSADEPRADSYLERFSLGLTAITHGSAKGWAAGIPALTRGGVLLPGARFASTPAIVDQYCADWAQRSREYTTCASAFDADRHFLVTCYNGQYELVDVQDREPKLIELKELADGTGKAFTDVGFVAGGDLLVAINEIKRVVYWRTISGESIKPPPGATTVHGAVRLFVSPRGNWVVTSDEHGDLYATKVEDLATVRMGSVGLGANVRFAGDKLVAWGDRAILVGQLGQPLEEVSHALPNITDVQTAPGSKGVFAFHGNEVYSIENDLEIFGITAVARPWPTLEPKPTRYSAQSAAPISLRFGWDSGGF
jgi:hypothetical protein